MSQKSYFDDLLDAIETRAANRVQSGMDRPEDALFRVLNDDGLAGTMREDPQVGQWLASQFDYQPSRSSVRAVYRWMVAEQDFPEGRDTMTCAVGYVAVFEVIKNRLKNNDD